MLPETNLGNEIGMLLVVDTLPIPADGLSFSGVLASCNLMESLAIWSCNFESVASVLAFPFFEVISGTILSSAAVACAVSCMLSGRMTDSLI